MGRGRISSQSHCRVSLIDKINNHRNRDLRRRYETGSPTGRRNSRRGCKPVACKSANDRTRQVSRKLCDYKLLNGQLLLGLLPVYLPRDPENKRDNRDVESGSRFLTYVNIFFFLEMDLIIFELITVLSTI